MDESTPKQNMTEDRPRNVFAKIIFICLAVSLKCKRLTNIQEMVTVAHMTYQTTQLYRNFTKFRYNQRNTNVNIYWVRIMVFNTTFNNISVISWRSVFFFLWWKPECPEKIHQPDKLYQIMLYRVHLT